MTDLSDIQDKLLADIFRLDEEFIAGSPPAATVNTSQTQSEISFSEIMDRYAKLKALTPARKKYFIDAETAHISPDLLDSPDVFVMPPAYEAMLPKQWKRRKFHPPYRKPALRPQWVATPKGIFVVDAPRSMFK